MHASENKAKGPVMDGGRSDARKGDMKQLQKVNV